MNDSMCGIEGPPIDLVALDVDGTLLRTDKRLSIRVVRAIHQVQQQGTRVVLASARPPRSMREIYEHLRLDTWQINYNGAVIHDPPTGRNVFHQPIAADLARRIVRTARKVDRKVVVSLEILDKWYTDHVDEDLPTETSRRFSPDFVGPLDSFLHVPVTKIMLLAPPDRLTRVRNAVDRKFGRQIALAVSDAHLLQVIHREVDKSRALATIAEHYNTPAERVMAIGDAPNDVGMLRWAGLGVAMQNAWEVALKAADVVVPSNDDDGVFVALERYVLNPSR